MPRTVKQDPKMTRSRYKIYETTHPYFFTCTVVDWIPIFTRPDIVDILLDSWRFLIKHERLVIYGYVILENHVHFIASAENLAKEISAFKSFTARKILDLLQDLAIYSKLRQLKLHKAKHKTDRTYQLWQEGSHPQMIQNEDIMRQKLDYIHYNPVRRELVNDPILWQYSSARNYAGKPSLLPVTTDWS